MNNLSSLRCVVLFCCVICLEIIFPINVFSQTDSQEISEIATKQVEPDVELEENKEPIIKKSKRVDLWKTAVRPDYTEIDKYVKECGGNCGKTPQEVADKITSICKSDIEKARAIYDWLAYNIAYDTTYSTYSAEAAFKRKKSICNGYAKLFQVMAQHVGLKSIFISGEAKNNLNYKPSASLTFGRGGGHAWNVVVLPDRDIILDATWGAGSVSGSVFKRSFDEYWFDVHPAEAIFTHFPEDMSYQLLEPRIDFDLFKELPYLVPVYGYSGLDPAEVLKYFLENPQSTSFTQYSTFTNLVLAGVKFKKLPLAKYLKPNQEYEIQYFPNNNYTITIENSKYEEIGRKVENKDGSISLFFSQENGKSLILYSSLRKNYRINEYYFADKIVPFSKRKALKIGLPRAIRVPKEIHNVSEFVQTGNKPTDGFFMSNTEVYGNELNGIYTYKKKYFFLPEQGDMLSFNNNDCFDYYPASKFTAEQCAAYCNYKSDKEGLSHCYSYDESGKIILDKTVNGYRVATLDEWMYVATDGTMQVPEDEEALAECARFKWNSAGYRYPVARGEPNVFGIYDMFGNMNDIVFDEETGEFCAIGGTVYDDYKEVVSLNKYKADKNGILFGSPRLVRSVIDDADFITKQADNFLNGYHVSSNYKNAFDWYMLGFEKGNKDAANSLGNMYLEGLYVEKNYNTALEYYLKAADMGSIIACYNIGLCYDKGYIGKENQKKAITWYQKAADLGDLNSIYRLSQYYYDGDVLPKNLEKYFEYLKKVVDNEYYDTKAYTDLAYCYEYGYGTEKDLNLAYKYFLKAAKLNSTLGMNRVADFHYEGIGMARPNYYEAENWYSKAAYKGNLYALVQISKMYYYGQYFNRNIDLALDKVQEAIDYGYKFADEYYAEVLRVKEQLDFYGENKDKLLKLIPENQNLVEFLETFTQMDTLSEKLSGSKIVNPFIFNGLTSEDIKSKVNNYLQLASESKEFPSETKVLLLVIPENWQKAHAITQEACNTNVFATKQRQMNREGYRFNESLFDYYDAIIPIKSKSIDAYMTNISPSLKGCTRTDMLLLSETLFDNLLGNYPKLKTYQTAIHDIWKTQIDKGVLPRLIAIGNGTDKVQKSINFMFKSDGEKYAEKIKVFGTPLDMTKEIALGFRNGNLLVCMLSKTFATKKAFRIYLDETGIKQGQVTEQATFIPDSKLYNSMKKEANNVTSCILKPGKMVMDYAVVRSY